MNHKINKILWTFPKYFLSPAPPCLPMVETAWWQSLGLTLKYSGDILELWGWSWLNIEALMCQTWCRLGLGCGCLDESAILPHRNLSNTGRLGFEVLTLTQAMMSSTVRTNSFKGFVNNFSKFKTFSKTVTALKWPRKMTSKNEETSFPMMKYKPSYCDHWSWAMLI